MPDASWRVARWKRNVVGFIAYLLLLLVAAFVLKNYDQYNFWSLIGCLWIGLIVSELQKWAEKGKPNA